MMSFPSFRRRSPAVAALIAALSLSGCAAVGPNFQRPDAPAPDGWLESAEPRLAGDSDHGEWWKSFSDPALEALIQRAYGNSQILEIAGLRIYEARAQLGIAVGTLYPQGMRARFSADRIELSENAEPLSYLPPDVQAGVDTDYSNFRLGFDAIWELDMWGRFRRVVEAADSNLAARVAAYDAVLVSLTGEVAANYILLRTIEKRIAVARSNAAIQKRSLEISEVRFRNELTSELDVVQAKVQYKDTEALIPRLEAALREVENGLSLLIGAAPGEVREVIGGAAEIPVTPTAVGVGLPADLLRRRPDIRQAEYLAAFQSARIGITKAELYPSFTLAGLVGWSADDLGDITDSDSFGGIAGGGFSWKLFNFGRIKNRVRANDALFQQALTNYEAVVLNAYREVENAQSAFLLSQQEVAHIAEAEEAAKRAVDLALVQYRDGIVDFNRVLIAQGALAFQQDALADARGRVARSLVAIFRSLGGGWQIREGKDFIPDDARDAMRERTNWGDLLDDGIQQVPENERGKWRAPD